MPRRPRSRLERRNTYGEHTHRPVNCLAFIALPLVCFHWGAAYYGSPLLAPYDVGKFLEYFGGTGTFLPPALIVVTLLFLQASHRERWQVQPKVLAGMLGESVLWMIPLVGISLIAGRLLLQAGGWIDTETIQKVLMAFGAGIYEEYVFRLLFFSFTMLLFVDVFGLPQDAVVPAAVIIGGALFSLYHFSAQPADAGAFPWFDFIFRTVAGIYLGGVFIYRGFGIAVGAHSLFNIYVFMSA